MTLTLHGAGNLIAMWQLQVTLEDQGHIERLCLNPIAKPSTVAGDQLQTHLRQRFFAGLSGSAQVGQRGWSMPPARSSCTRRSCKSSAAGETACVTL
jgi:hypothetical protein